MNKFIFYLSILFLFTSDFALSQNSKETIEKRRIEKYIELGSGTFYLNDEVGIKKASAAYSLDVYSNDADWMAQFDQDNASGLGILVNMDSNDSSTVFRITNSVGTIMTMQTNGVTAIDSSSVNTFSSLKVGTEGVERDLLVAGKIGSAGGDGVHIGWDNSNLNGRIFAADSSSFYPVQIQGGVYENKGNVSATHNVFTTLVTFPTEYAYYSCHIYCQQNDAAYHASVNVVNNGTSNINLHNQNDATSVQTTISGKALQARQTSGGTLTIYWSCMKQAG